MKIKNLIALLIPLCTAATPYAHATNGDTMIAVGSENSALGGTGVAHFVGAESTFANPAMLGKSQGMEVTGGIIYFSPKVTNDGMGGTVSASSTKNSYIPNISFSSRISDSLTYGFAMAGIAGMGVNYTDAPASHVQAKTSLSILRIVPTIAYNNENYGIGFSPVFQYGSLAISYNAGVPVNGSHGASSDTNIGFSLGGYVNPSQTLTLAAAYYSAIRMTYGTQLSTAGKGFGQGVSSPGTTVFTDNLEQPAEIKAGISYDAANNFTLTSDYRLIQWASADGYKDFGWKDQTVIAIGAKFSGGAYWLGAGYNYANNPIGVFNNGAPLTPASNNGGIVNMFNNLMFPGIIKSSYTLGGGYTLNKNFDVETSLVFSPKVTTRVDISDAIAATSGSLFNTTTHSQQSMSMSVRYKF